MAAVGREFNVKYELEVGGSRAAWRIRGESILFVLEILPPRYHGPIRAELNETRISELYGVQDAGSSPRGLLACCFSRADKASPVCILLQVLTCRDRIGSRVAMCRPKATTLILVDFGQ
jgi:hypothetical protein